MERTQPWTHMKWALALSQSVKDLGLWNRGGFLPTLSLHMAIPSLVNFRSDIAKQQNGSLFPRANLRLQIRVTCIQGDGIRHFCTVSASSVGSDRASPNSIQKLGCISNAAKDCLPNIITETKLSVPIDFNLVSKAVPFCLDAHVTGRIPWLSLWNILWAYPTFRSWCKP